MKRMSLEKFKERFPEYIGLVMEMIRGFKVPRKRFITIDFMKRSFKVGESTRLNTRWHCDGVNNNYCLFVVGPDHARTEFYKGTLPDVQKPSKSGDELLEYNNAIDEALAEAKGEPVPNEKPFYYTSNDIHRGRVVAENCHRIFLRVCSSDYIKPKEP